MINWRAWHWDGNNKTIYSSADGDWQALPPEGIVGVVIYLDPPYRRIIDGYDWIWLENGELHTVQTHDEWGKWAPRPDASCGSCVKRGSGVPDDIWSEIQREMMESRKCP